MDRKECQGCSHKHHCQEVYGLLGKSTAPAITLKIFLAFVLPLAAFVAGIATCQKLLDSRIASQSIVILLSLAAGILAGLFAAAIGTLIIRLKEKSRKAIDKCPQKPEEQ